MSHYRTKQTKTDNLSLILWQVEKFYIGFSCYYVDSIFCSKNFSMSSKKEEKFFHFRCYEKKKSLMTTKISSFAEKSLSFFSWKTKWEKFLCFIYVSWALLLFSHLLGGLSTHPLLVLIWKVIYVWWNFGWIFFFGVYVVIRRKYLFWNNKKY